MEMGRPLVASLLSYVAARSIRGIFANGEEIKYMPGLVPEPPKHDIPVKVAEMYERAGHKEAMDRKWKYIGKANPEVKVMFAICCDAVRVQCTPSFHRKGGTPFLLFVGQCPKCRDFFWFCQDPEGLAKAMR